MSEVGLRISINRKTPELSRLDWNAIAGTPAWFRMRRNAVVISFEKLTERWAGAARTAEAVRDAFQKWLGKNAKDAFFIEAMSNSVEVFFYDERDAVNLKLNWHQVEGTYNVSDY